MKLKKILSVAFALAASTFALASCGPAKTTDPVEEEKDYIDNYLSNSEIVNSTPVVTGNTIYCSPNADLNGQGSKEDPMPFEFAIKEVKAGDQILLMAGRYDYSYRLEPGKGPTQATRSTSGAPGKYITVKPENEGEHYYSE